MKGFGKYSRGLAGMVVLAMLAVSSTALAWVVSPVQSAVRPFGLAIAGDVQLAGSDSRAAAFQGTVLPEIQSTISTVLAEKRAIADGTMVVDPNDLVLATDHAVRVYFVGEGAAFSSSVGANTAGGGAIGGSPVLVFPNASSRVSYYGGGGAQIRIPGTPLLPGDFVDLGLLSAGTKLDFFLIADGANGGTRVYSTDASVNHDGLEHTVSLQAQSAAALHLSSYVVVGFEDLKGGGDQDFNDVVIAVDIGGENVNALVSGAEPSTILLLGTFLTLFLWMAHRRVARETL